jgi:hypothetical protein
MDVNEQLHVPTALSRELCTRYQKQETEEAVEKSLMLPRVESRFSRYSDWLRAAQPSGWSSSLGSVKNFYFSM